ncbi:MAG: beta-aspartate methyltransferase [Deltaproteobacteria bacterium]|nr:beta-aspartate methyltransferase [Deltaproteobacteria bacterium]
MIRVAHYVNQFFGGIGGEDKADMPPRLVEGMVGPGKAVQAALGDQGEVVATVICGDNYFAEHVERASEEVRELLRPYKPDLLVAGPAFNAGRYGIACGATCRMAQNNLGIPAITGMYEGNPGVDLYRKDVYIIQTKDSARGMVDAVNKMVTFAGKLLRKENIGRPAEEGYFARGQLINETADRTGAERVVDMLLAKLRAEPFESEVARPFYDRVKPALRIKDIHSATIALVTDGGLVPKGNPDKIEMITATRFGRYDIKNIDTLNPEAYEVSHGGYDSTLVRQDPNRLVPVDAMRDLEREGVIGKLHDTFYSTTGLASIVDIMKKVGQGIAESLKAEGVSGVILTST